MLTAAIALLGDAIERSQRAGGYVIFNREADYYLSGR
jgi:hypothetical protein